MNRGRGDYASAGVVVVPGIGLTDAQKAHDDYARNAASLRTGLTAIGVDTPITPGLAPYYEILSAPFWATQPKSSDHAYRGGSQKEGHRWECTCCSHRSGRGLMDRLTAGMEPIVSDGVLIKIGTWLDDDVASLKAFLDRPGMRQAARDLLDPAMVDHPRIVIGHSMGSVVALDYLAHAAWQPELFITVGSPLPIGAIRHRLDRRHVAWAADRTVPWVNFHDRKDPTTAGRAMPGDWFPGVVNVRIKNPSDKHHSLGEGLKHESVAALVVDVLDGRRSGDDLWAPNEKRPRRTSR